MLTKLLKGSSFPLSAAVLSLMGVGLLSLALTTPVAEAASTGTVAEAGPPQSISITTQATAFTVGDTLAFVATAVYPDGSTAKVTHHSIWTSSISAIARIKKDGMHGGHAVLQTVGSVSITATYKGVTGSTALDVQPPATSQTFDEDGVFTVPAGVRTLTVVAEGGSGGAYSFTYSVGAPGATVAAVLKLPRQVEDLSVVVGVSGQGGTNTGGGPGGASSFGPGGYGAYSCGGGGGASGLFLGAGSSSQASSLVVAGGGGGSCSSFYPAPGGAAGTLSPGEGGNTGGGGAGATDQTAGAGGTAVTYDDGVDPPLTGSAGYAGSGSDGGGGGRSYFSSAPSDVSPYWGGAGGGGGYFGGGGGAASWYGSNGGGGSSFVAAQKLHGIKTRLVYASNQLLDYAQPGSVLIYWK